jgi:hypothetical protein
MKKIILFFICSLIIEQSFSQNSVEVYPSNWWVGMKWNKVQLMIHEKNISNQIFLLSPYAGVKLLKVNKVENPNYVFIDLSIGQMQNREC